MFWFCVHQTSDFSCVQALSSRHLKNRGFPLVILKEAGYPGVIIFGEPEYYPKHGFQRAGTFGLTDAEGNVFDAFMGIEFVPGLFQFRVDDSLSLKICVPLMMKM